MANRARTVADVIAAEAVHGTLQQRFNDMVHIASVIANRSRLGRVTPQQVVSVQNEFNAYNKAMPPGTKALRGLAQRAMKMVEENGPITPATYYATPTARKSLPKGLQNVAQTTGHVYAVDPQGRAFKTALGYVRPTESQVTPTQPTDAVRRPSVDVAPNPNSYTVARSRQFTPPDRTMPMGEMSMANLSRQPGPGLAALAPNGLRDLPGRAQPAVSYNMGPNRPNPPNRSITELARAAINDTVGMGPNYSMSVISGKENAGKQFGSNRHKTGLAADINVYDPTGRKLNVVQDRQKMMDLARTMAAKGATGIGIGSNYMGATGIHVDQTQPGPGQANTWGNLGAKYRSELVDAMKTAEMPASYYNAKMPSQMAIVGSPRAATPAYEASQRQALAAAMEKAGVRGLGATTQVAPVGQVTRQSLPPDRPMPTGTPATQSLAPDRPMPTGPVARPALAAAVDRARPMPTGPVSQRPTSLAPDRAMPTGPVSQQPTSLAPDRAMPTGPVAQRPTSLPPDRPMPVGPVARPNLAAAVEKRAAVAPTPSATMQPGVPQTRPTVTPSPVTPTAPVAPQTLTPTGPIQTRPKVAPAVPAPTIAPPTISPPRVVQPPQQRVVQPVAPPVQTPPVQTPPQPLSQQAFNARYAAPTPGLKPSDVYSGAVGSAYATGGNIVSRENSYGPTTVTNKYGVTTATMPDGKQAAYNPSFGPDLSKLSGAARPAIGGLAGGALGSLIGGPVGGIIGGLLGRQVVSGGLGLGGGGASQPGGGGGQASGGLGGLLGGLFGDVKGNQRGGGERGGGGAPGSKPSPTGGGGGKGSKRK